MPFIDLGQMLRAEQEQLNAGYYAVTETTTALHMEADEAEASGDQQHANNLRTVAEDAQTTANMYYRPRSN